jgi:hypothetical protein
MHQMSLQAKAPYVQLCFFHLKSITITISYVDFGETTL